MTNSKTVLPQVGVKSTPCTSIGWKSSKKQTSQSKKYKCLKRGIVSSRNETCTYAERSQRPYARRRGRHEPGNVQTRLAVLVGLWCLSALAALNWPLVLALVVTENALIGKL